MVHVPAVPDAVYVTVATPLALVNTLGALNVPHAPAGEPLEVKLTLSTGTGPPLEFVTVALMVDVVVLSAGTLFGVALTLTALAMGRVSLMTTVPVPVPVGPPSLAVIVQLPPTTTMLEV
jgi:hypothetical protein